MIFAAKIEEETRAFERFVRKCKGIRQKDIMEQLNISRSSVYRILKGLKKGPICIVKNNNQRPAGLEN